jgi:hypothetical protein
MSDTGMTVDDALCHVAKFCHTGVDAEHGSWFLNLMIYRRLLEKLTPGERAEFVKAETPEKAAERLSKPK